MERKDVPRARKDRVLARKDGDLASANLSQNRPKQKKNGENNEKITETGFYGKRYGKNHGKIHQIHRNTVLAALSLNETQKNGVLWLHSFLIFNTAWIWQRLYVIEQTVRTFVLNIASSMKGACPTLNARWLMIDLAKASHHVVC